MDVALALLLDELAANAISAPVVQMVDGWALRAAPNWPFRRTSSALPLRPAGRPAAALAAAEAFYSRRGLPARVQVSAAAPSGLDALLAEHGYVIEAPVDILVGAGDGGALRAPVAVDVTDELSDATIAAIAPGDPRLIAYAQMLPTVGPPAHVATATLDGRVAGVAIAVVERGWVGIFGMRTRTDARRRGVATSVLSALRALAPRCYLQVETDNDAARVLYESAGFTRAYGYHYRTRAEL